MGIISSSSLIICICNYIISSQMQFTRILYVTKHLRGKTSTVLQFLVETQMLPHKFSDPMTKMRKVLMQLRKFFCEPSKA